MNTKEYVRKKDRAIVEDQANTPEQALEQLIEDLVANDEQAPEQAPEQPLEQLVEDLVANDEQAVEQSSEQAPEQALEQLIEDLVVNDEQAVEQSSEQAVNKDIVGFVHDDEADDSSSMSSEYKFNNSDEREAFMNGLMLSQASERRIKYDTEKQNRPKREALEKGQAILKNRMRKYAFLALSFIVITLVIAVAL